MRWCERHALGYLIGVARNARLHQAVEAWQQERQAQYRASGIEQRQSREFRHAAKGWDRERRTISRLAFGNQGANARFIVTNLDLPAAELYDGLYCQRGEAQKRSKETPLDLFGARTSRRRFLANWLLFAAHYPRRELFLTAACALACP